jgi:hypothetical protein
MDDKEKPKPDSAPHPAPCPNDGTPVEIPALKEK